MYSAVVATANEEFASALTKRLHGNGCRVVLVVTTLSELRLTEDFEPELYIMDNFGPENAGLGEARKLHASHRQVFWIDAQVPAPDGIPWLSDWAQLDRLAS